MNSLAYRYKASTLYLGTAATKSQRKRISMLGGKNFPAAQFSRKSNSISFTSFQEYDEFIAYIKELVKVKQDLSTTIKITDNEENTYWIVKILGTELEELYGSVIWGDSKDKAKVISVLEAHLNASKEKLNEIATQIIAALKGYYDDEQLDITSDQLVGSPSGEDESEEEGAGA